MLVLAFLAAISGGFAFGVLAAALCFCAREDELQYVEAEKVAHRIGLN